MTASDDHDNKPIIVVDPYRIVLHAKPADLGEQAPQSWSDVARQVNRHLMRIAAGPTRLIAELFESTTRVLRGIARVPEAVANRVDRAHENADALEACAQQALLANGAHETTQSLTIVESVLTKYRVQGHYADVVSGPKGDPVIVIVRPEIANTIDATTTVPELPAGQDLDAEKRGA